MTVEHLAPNTILLILANTATMVLQHFVSLTILSMVPATA
jgi:hypothetical protein